MPSLKEVKNRIMSVGSTRKITSAMKMVASSKLHHAQQVIENMRPYEAALDKIMSAFVTGMEGDISSPYAIKRPVRQVAVVAYTSNASLCGAFNGNVVKSLRQVVDNYKASGIKVVKVYAIGKKGYDAARKAGYPIGDDLSALLEHPNYDGVARIAQELMSSYLSGEVDEVTMLYHHFKSSSTQVMTAEKFLPIGLDTASEAVADAQPTVALDYIVEPSKEEIVEELIPKTLCLKLYAALLDSLASEHAARVIAMQVATDNADELLRELTLTYNKTRQQAITTELLDIVGGSMQ